MRFERRIAVLAILFGLGFALLAADLTFHGRIGPVGIAGTGLEIVALVGGWFVRRDPTEFVGVGRRRNLAVWTTGAGVALLAATVALVAAVPAGSSAGITVVVLGAPYLGAALATRGAKNWYDLRGRVDPGVGGF